MERYCFTARVEPQGKQRPRFDSRSRRTYTPAKTIQYEWDIQKAFKDAYPVFTPLTGDVALEISVTFQMPKSWGKKKRKEMSIAYCRKKPDTDNIAKAILDALNGRAYVDDAQVVALHVCKYWDEESSVEVSFYEAP